MCVFGYDQNKRLRFYSAIILTVYTINLTTLLYTSGWPSFRDQEVVWENVRVLKDGETVSLTGTHLGTFLLLIPPLFRTMRIENSIVIDREWRTSWVGRIFVRGF